MVVLCRDEWLESADVKRLNSVAGLVRIVLLLLLILCGDESLVTFSNIELSTLVNTLAIINV